METKEKNKRKLLLVLPLLVLPFLSLAFFALGGGKGDLSSETQAVQKGINTDLPDAQFKRNDPQDKLSLYELTKRDSAKVQSDLNNFYLNEEIEDNSFPTAKNYLDPNEQRIQEKLSQINREINKPVHQNSSKATNTYPTPSSKIDIGSDVDRLEKLMKTMQAGGIEDPEMEQLSGMLDKIMVIQNPGLAGKISIKTPSNNDNAFEAIPVVIEGDQKVSQGGVVKLRLLDTIRLRGQMIPKNQLLFGSCNITNQRLILNINTIRLGNSIIPVDLSVYDLDGIKGINVPEALIKDAVNDGTEDAIRDIQLMTIDQSIATQVAGAGINAAKGLISKKVKRIKVKLKAGQSVLLRNNAIKDR
ncbi:MAG: conjugative transposon protein TraM [Pedobacter sp.]